MREILFRAKREDIGEWVYGYYVRMPDAAGSAHRMYVPAENPDESNNVFYIDPETVGQYTGLTDKNGVKIFEDDIIQTDDSDEEPAKVFYDEGETEFAVIIDNCYYGLGSNFNETDLTVIGNIHDNPEQLWDGDSE